MTALELCPRCGRYARERVHLIGASTPWQGGPLPPMRWCTPTGAVDLPFHQNPPIPRVIHRSEGGVPPARPRAVDSLRPPTPAREGA